MKCSKGSESLSGQPGHTSQNQPLMSSTGSQSGLGLQTSCKEECESSGIISTLKSGVAKAGHYLSAILLGIVLLTAGSGVANAQDPNQTDPVVPGEIDTLGLDYQKLINAVETGIAAFLTPVIIFMLGLVLVSAFVMWLTARKR